MKMVLKGVAWIAGILALLVLFAVWKPMSFFGIVWPLVDAIAVEDFVGVTNNGEIQKGLFTIEATGENTQPIVDAAQAFLDTLTQAQQQAVKFGVDDDEWQQWANVHIAKRQGLGLLDFNQEQAEAAHKLLQSGLSRRGYQTALNVMKLEGYLADLLDNHVEYGEKRYWFTIMGEPSATEPWGWQIDGHHLVINFFVLGDQVVMTPTFMGSEPPFVSEGAYQGLSILDDELDAGLALINSLTPQQQAQAIVEPNKISNNAVAELYQDNVVIPYQGIALSELDELQRRLAADVIRLYTGHMRTGHDQVKFTEIVKHWDQTYFSWVGGVGGDAVFYYRFHSPVVLIEYDQQRPIALPGENQPTRNHVHTVVRTPNGNDYGKDLLRQHLQQHPH